MNKFEINAEPRADVGKGASRRLRRTGVVPAVIYGAKKDAQPITLKHHDIINHLEHEAFYSHILNLNVAGKGERVVLKDLQRHPAKPAVLHIDFLRVDENEKLNMRVPLHFLNAEQCVGVKLGGGIVSHIMTELEISCLPKDLPEYVEIDLLEVNVGETIHLADLKLPEGVEIYSLLHGGDDALPVVSVNVPRVVEEEETPADAPEADAGAAAPEADSDAE